MPKTLFIVGAGASSEFGLPLGSALAGEIRGRLQDELRNGISSPRLLMDGAIASGTTGDWGQAAKELAGGLISARSIDRLLDSRSSNPLVVELGKFSIAQVIAERERNSHLSEDFYGDWDKTHAGLTAAATTWIGTLFSILQEGIRPQDAQKIFADTAFVTFNYDRVIERYFRRAFQHILSLPPKDAIAIADGIQVEHVYGSLGKLDSNLNPPASFGVTDKLVRHTVSSFRTFTEGGESGQLQVIRDVVKTAELIVFIGFAFDPLNLDALFDQQLSPGQKVCATTVALGDSELARVRSRLGLSGINSMFANAHCADFIRSDGFRAFFNH